MTNLNRVLGIDPGLNTTGYALIEVADKGPKLIEAGVIQPVEGRSSADLTLRLKAIYEGVIEVIEQFRPTTLAVEQLYAHYDHPRTAILMAHARGAIFVAAGNKGLSVASYASTQVKKAITGSGRASKEQMQLTMLREFRLSAMPEPHDVADAMAIALCHCYQLASSGVVGTSPRGVGIRMSALHPNHKEE